jgi:hypothetical protein
MGASMSNTSVLASASDPHVFLIGRPPIGELLAFIRTMAVDGQSVDMGALTSEWRAANDHVLKLEKDEAGASDNPPITPLAESLYPLAEALIADPVYQHAYRYVPTDVAVIDLNRVVVFQKFINLSYVDELKRRLGSTPSPTAVFRLALPLQPEQPQFQMMQNAQNMYTLMSNSTDLRFLEAQILQPRDVPSLDSAGRPVTILGLTVGYGSNFLNVLHVENRLVLGNGSHRAYALRDLGITEIPCLVQRVTRRDELELVASGDLASNPDRYLKSARPPMLRDYFDPALRKIVPVYRKNRVVRVQFGIEQTDIPAQ